MTGPSGVQARAATELLLTGITLAGATAAGSLLFAIAQHGDATLPHLITQVGVPGAIAVALAPLLALRLGHRGRLGGAVLLGGAAGIAGTVVLEAVRETGFRAFHSMPGDLPMLMGVLLTNRIMKGPDTASNLAGWGYHVWNGAMFGITYAALLGGFPRRRSGAMAATLMGTVYGLLLGTGFLASPVPKALGAGSFGTDFGARFAVTVYLAHAGFGALTGWLVHRFGARITPLWSVALALLPPRTGRRMPPRPQE